MNFDWNEYLLLSKYLTGESINGDITGAKLRSAVSRTYYSVFNITKSHLFEYCQIDDNAPDFKDYRDKLRLTSHVIIHRLLEVNNDEDISIAGRNLFTLKKKRVKADYDSKYSRHHVNPIARDVKDSFEYAEKILSALKLISDRKVEIKLEHLNRLVNN